jgi:hypothetical protein
MSNEELAPEGSGLESPPADLMGDSTEAQTFGELEEQLEKEEEKPKAKRSKRFDPSKPFATVHGTTPARYFQDGVYYGADKKVVKVEL